MRQKAEIGSAGLLGTIRFAGHAGLAGARKRAARINSAQRSPARSLPIRVTNH